MASMEESPRQRAVTFASKVKRKFKYLSAKEFTGHECVYNLAPSAAAPAIAASDRFWAVPYASGGGGPVYVSALDAVGKVEPVDAPARFVVGHKAPAHCVAFSPCHAGLLATGAEDCRVRLADVAGDAALPLESAELGAHGSGVRALAWHPAAEHVLLSAAADGSWATWDAETQATLGGGALGAAAASVDWHGDGGALFLASCRDKHLRCVDARAGTEAWRCVPHGGARQFRALWAGGVRGGGGAWAVASVGAAARGGREVALLDARQPAEPLWRADVDAQAGDLLPFWDPDAALLWCWGRGDRGARPFEVDFAGATASEAVHPCAAWTTTSAPAAAICPLPHQLRDVLDLEVQAFLRLTAATVERVSFRVPRTAELKSFFNDDIFAPATRARSGSSRPAAWAAGDDAPPALEATRLRAARETRVQPDRTSIRREQILARKVLHTAVVNEQRATDQRLRAEDDASMDRLSKLADMYATHNINRSMGAKPGVDAAVVDGDDVGSDEWDDSD